MAVPFGLGARHRLVVRSTEHHAIFVGRIQALRIVIGDRTAPHGRPQIIALQPQQKLEDVGIGLVIDAAELFLGPAAEGRILVIDEEAAILDLWPVAGHALADRNLVMMGHRHVGPPVPGRDADARRQVVGAEDGAAPVRTDNDQGLVDARQGMIDHRLLIGFPLAGNGIDLELA